MRHAVLVPILVGVATLGGCSEGILDPKGPIASAEWLLLINSTAIMLVVVVPVVLATLAFAWWYRASNPRASRQPAGDYEGRVEFVIWSIPALIVILFLGGILDQFASSWIRARRSPRTPSRCGSMSSRSIGNGCSSTRIRTSPAVNELVMPAGTPVTSASLRQR